MQLEELKEKKAQLEKTILSAIKKFQDETGLILYDLELETKTEKITTGQKQVIGQKVKVTVRI